MADEYYKSEASVKEYISLSKDVNGAEIIERLKAQVPAGAKILEIGSGPGSDWEILSQNYKVLGSDFSEVFVKHLRETFPKGEFIELDATSIEFAEKFDGIYANKVLHHLTNTDLRLSLEQQAERLNPNGVVCHTYWRGSGSEIFKGMYVNYHEIADLKKMYAPNFEIITLESYQEFEANDSIFVIAKKKEK